MPRTHRTEFKIQNFNRRELSDIQREYNNMIQKKETPILALSRQEFNEIIKKLKEKNYKLYRKDHDQTYNEESPGNTSFDKVKRKIEVQNFEIRKDYSRSPSRRTLSRILLGRNSGGKKRKTRKNRKM